ncbi:MAG: RNA polymerase sigma factor [Oscillospiraceae bacterium]
MNDSDIISLYQQRSEDALRETERKYSRYLTAIARNILADEEDSRECVNDTYLRAWNTIPPQMPQRLSAYLGKITRELSISRWRAAHAAKRGGSQYALSLDELAECIPDNSTEHDYEASLLEKAVSKFVKALPQKQRRIFVCRYFFCDSIRDIAGYFAMSEAAVKTVLFRTREKLKNHLEQEGFTI